MRAITALLVLPVVLILSAAASAQTLRVSADKTNLRDKPATDGAIVASLTKGDELEVLEKAGTWYRVRVKATAREGYVHSLVVEMVAATPAPAATAPAPTPAPVPAPPGPRSGSGTSQTSSQRPAPSDRTYFMRAFGGLITGYGDAGFLVGGGAGFRPFGNERMEVALDAAYGRGGQTIFSTDISTTVLAVSGNFVYNFELPNQGFTPYAGAGLVISRSTVSITDFDYYGIKYGGTFSTLQILAGIEKPLSDKTAFRGEFRSGFYSFGSSVLLLAGVSF